MAEKNEVFEENQGMLITLTDDNGNDVDFEFLGIVEYDNDEFVVLIENVEDADEVVIFKINALDEENEEYVAIADDELLQQVYEKFKSEYDGDITFE